MDDYPLILVVWLDHTGESGWQTKKQVKNSKPARVKTIGWLVHEDKDTIKVCNSILKDGDLGGADCILRQCIVKRYEVDIK